MLLDLMSAQVDPDAALMLRVREGDRDAFALLVDRYKQPVMNLVARTLRDLTEAEDVAQHVFLQVYKSAHRYEVTAKFSTWIFTIARNRRIDLLRHERRPEIDPNDPELRPADPEDAETALQRAQIGERLRNAIGSLPRDQEEALAATFFNDRSYGDYAAQSGLPLGTVKSRLRLAMARLRLELKEAH